MERYFRCCFSWVNEFTWTQISIQFDRFLRRSLDCRWDSTDTLDIWVERTNPVNNLLLGQKNVTFLSVSPTGWTSRPHGSLLLCFSYPEKSVRLFLSRWMNARDGLILPVFDNRWTVDLLSSRGHRCTTGSTVTFLARRHTFHYLVYVLSRWGFFSRVAICPKSLRSTWNIAKDSMTWARVPIFGWGRRELFHKVIIVIKYALTRRSGKADTARIDTYN